MVWVLLVVIPAGSSARRPPHEVVGVADHGGGAHQLDHLVGRLVVLEI